MMEGRRKKEEQHLLVIAETNRTDNPDDGREKNKCDYQFMDLKGQTKTSSSIFQSAFSFCWRKVTNYSLVKITPYKDGTPLSGGSRGFRGFTPPPPQISLCLSYTAPIHILLQRDGGTQQ